MTTTGNSHHVLCIDDYEPLLTAQKELLESQGYTVLTAPDGPTGIQVLEQHPIQVIVLDYQMPGMNGGEVATVVRKRHPKIRIILLTGVIAQVPEKTLKTFDIWISKGEGPSVLLSALEAILRKKARAA